MTKDWPDLAGRIEGDVHVLPIRVYFEETPYAHGPGGAKGIGELPMDGAAPAIANAVSHALGVNITRIPITPESVFDLMEARA